MKLMEENQDCSM